MNKTELTKHVAHRAGLSQAQALAAISALETTITNVLRGGSAVTLIGFGSFTVKERAARTGRNPKTGEEIQIAATKVPTFKPGKALKEAVNG